ncbi:hypothetical protein FRC03_000956 [Tulasnella sp. 419]|nr:hypothetical protein FRC03_000956 [Tulasnella sp. 419]
MNPADMFSSLQGATQQQTQRWPENIGYAVQQQSTPQSQQQRLSLSNSSFPSAPNGIAYSQQPQTTPQHGSATPQNTLTHSSLSYDPSLYSLTNSQTNGSSSSTPQSTNSFYSYPSHTIPYYALASTLPISQWSSLSGATGTPSTSTSTTTEHATKAPSTSTTSVTGQLAIDPSLTSMAASVNPYSVQQYRMPPTASVNPQAFQSHSAQQQQQQQQSQQQLQTPQQHTYQQLQSPQVIAPHMLVRSPATYTNGIPTTYSTQPIQQQSQQTQSALSGAVQISPYFFTSTSYQSPQPSASTPSSSSTPQPAPMTIASVLPTILELLSPRSLDKSPVATAQSVISHLSSISWADVDSPTRLKILTKIRDGAGQEFYGAWAKSSAGMDILRDWLKTTVTKEGYDETLMPLLFIIERLPLGLEELTASKIGKVVRKVGREASSSAVRDLASSIEAKWRKLLPQELKSNGPAESQNVTKVKAEEDARSKKRKIEGPPPKAAPPLKKPAVTSAATARPTVTTAVKKEATTAAAATKPTKDVKTDSSFFSSKPKPKLPSFKKNPVVPKKEEPVAETAQPSSIDPFQEALKSMSKGRSPLAEPSKPASGGPSPVTDRPVTIGKNGKPKKVVTFPADDKLVLIKYIERAVYDDDVGGGSHHTSYRDLDIDEGHALHAHRFEEQVDWYEPIAIELSSEIEDVLKRGSESTEIAAQEEREKSALMAAYMSSAQIPESPSDLYAPPSADAPLDESDMTIMLPGPEVANLEVEPPTQTPISTQLPPSTPSLQDLLAKITIPMPTGDTAVSNPSGFETNGLAGYPNYGQPADNGGDMVWQRTGNAHQQPPPTIYGNQQDGWGQLPPGSGYQEEWDNESFSKGRRRGEGNWRGGAGRGSRGRPFQRKHCTFFQEGRCRHGDNCNFLHEYA